MLLRIILTLLLFASFVGCSNNDGEKKDTSELYAKSAQVDEIIKRSGTKMDPDNPRSLADAENRLRTGGGLFGKKGITLEVFENFNENNKGSSTSIGLPINSVLWKSSLEVISFMPISSADPFSGVIITDWYSSTSNKDQRCKLNVFIKGAQLKSQNLEVNSFCQMKESDNWIDIANNQEDDLKIENAILNQAKKIKLSSN